MAELLQQIISHPYGDMVVVLSVLAAIGFLIFFWGFSGYILAHGDSDHQQHARIQMIQGMSFFIMLVLIWELIRWIVSWFA